MKKKGLISDYVPWLLIGVAVLVILMITLAVLKDQGIVMIDKLKNFFSG